MATLTIRNVPDELLAKIKLLAAQEGRSINAEVLVLLERGISQAELRQQRLDALQRISERRMHTHPVEVDSTTLLREDRAG